MEVPRLEIFYIGKQWKTGLFFDDVTRVKGPLAQIQLATILFRVFEPFELGGDRSSTKDTDFVRLLGTDAISRFVGHKVLSHDFTKRSKAG